MGDHEDEKSKESLPTYMPLPQDEHGDPVADALRKRRCHRCRTFVRLVVVLFITGVWLHYLFKKGGKSIRKIAYHQYNDADYFAASSIFGDEARRPYPSKCHKWSNESSVEDSTFTYSFPTNSSVLHFTSRGHFVGTVDYVLAKSSASGKFINVSVTLGATGSYTGGSSKHDKHSYWIKLRPSWWPCKRRHPKKPRAKVCLLNEPGSQDPSGLAILTPPSRKGGRWRWFGRHDPPRFPHPPVTPPGEPRHPHPVPPPDAPLPRPAHPYPPEVPSLWDLAHSLHYFDENEHIDHHPHPHPHRPHHHCHGKKHKGGKKYEHSVPIVHARVTITIPRGALKLPELHSVFPGLEQHVGDVFDDVTFGDVTLVGKDVAVDTVIGGKAVVVADGGRPINGSFTVSERLSIVAKGSPITANVTMFSSPGAEKPTVLDVVNNNATISTTISLLVNSTTETGSPNGFFAISQVTTQADITSNVKSQPLDSILRFTAASKNANVTASFPPAYQGRFGMIASRHGANTIHSDPDVEDPSGEGRKRHIESKVVIGFLVTGSVSWRRDEAFIKCFDDAPEGTFHCAWVSRLAHVEPPLLSPSDDEALPQEDHPLPPFPEDGDEELDEEDVLPENAEEVMGEVPEGDFSIPPPLDDDGAETSSISLLTSAGTNLLNFL